jgi:hypothetical protein
LCRQRRSGNVHDILTGSTPTGRASGRRGHHCGQLDQQHHGSAIVGHFDRSSTFTGERAKSWTLRIASRGCSMDGAQVHRRGGGLLYCFAAN